ncbi:MAG TPA: MFS transporter, partial [Vicinamibacterales bacterium]|nr:MFS transporter [Vicinamibacterales bacterium]
DGFDFTILTFILVDIEHSFTVSKALAGALGTVTLLFRVAGGIGAGTAADRWGRKLPLMFSILWYSLFAFLSGFSTSYAMLFGLRALFGIGMGGVWAAAMPLTIEHWPPHLRGIASGLLQGGWSWGFMLSTLVYTFIYPLVNTRPDFGWRAMFWIGVLPALMIFWIVKQVKESPVWLARQAHLKERRQTDQVSLLRIFQPDLLGVTLQTSILMGAFIFSYHSLTFWYPTFLQTSHLAPLRFLVTFNAGSIAGAFIWGHISESRLGRRGAAMLAMLGGVATIPIYVMSHNVSLLWLGALLMGLTASGAWGVVPSYLTERFPTAVRGVGAGFAYHVGAGLGSFTPFLIGALQDRGMALPHAMTLCITTSCLLVTLMMWIGPETRGRTFAAVDEADVAIGLIH